MALQAVDLSEHQFAPVCETCDDPAVYICKGCMDKAPVLLCEMCFDRGIDVIRKYVHLWQRLNKRVMICADCSRPVLDLGTHLDVRRLA